MDISFPGSVISSSQIAHIFNNTVTSSLRHAELTAAVSSGPATNKEGCRILQETSYNPSNNPENMVKLETLEWAIAIIYGGFIPLLYLVGFPCNLLSAAVFYKQGLKERINLCIFCLALVDSVVITYYFTTSVEAIYRRYIGHLDVFLKNLSGLNGFTWVSMFLTTVIASERCFCVVSPLRAQRMLSTRTMAIIIISVSLILLAGMAAIVGPKRRRDCQFNTQTNKTTYIISYTEYYYKNRHILDPIDIFLYGTTLPFTAFTCVIVTTGITIKKLRSAMDWRRQSSSASAAQLAGSLEYHALALTRMLVGTSLLFVMCLSPSLVLQMHVWVVPGLLYGGRYNNLMRMTWVFIILFRYLNSSLNFFIYYKMGSRFRSTLKQLLCCGGGNTDVFSSYTVDSTLAKSKS